MIRRLNVLLIEQFFGLIIESICWEDFDCIQSEKCTLHAKYCSMLLIFTVDF